MMEEALPPGQVWGKKFVIYAALGIPRVDPQKWRLKVDGLVNSPLEYTYSQLTSLPQTRYVKSFFCVTRWSIKDVDWEGVPIRDLVSPAGPKPEAKWVMFHCEEGYSAPVPIEDALNADALLAFKLNGKPLRVEKCQMGEQNRVCRRISGWLLGDVWLPREGEHLGRGTVQRRPWQAC